MANARSAGSCMRLRAINEIAASTIAARQAAKKRLHDSFPVSVNGILSHWSAVGKHHVQCLDRPRRREVAARHCEF